MTQKLSTIVKRFIPAGATTTGLATTTLRTGVLTTTVVWAFAYKLPAAAIPIIKRSFFMISVFMFFN